MDLSEVDDMQLRKTTSYDFEDGIPRFTMKLESITPARVGASKALAPHVSTFLGKAGSAGLDVLDTLGTGMTNLYPSGFVPNTASRWNKVSVFTFEVANTIVRGSNLMQSLSEEDIYILIEEILHSDGVRKLVSMDTKELLSIAAADKREEFEVFSREVVRFGNMCKNPQWHNMDLSFGSDRYFKYGIRREINQPLSNLKKSQKGWFSFSQTERSMNRYLYSVTMQQLVNLARHSSELYHECEALGRFEQDYRCELEKGETLDVPRKGKSLTKLYSQLKHQKKLVRKLQKKSLWSKSWEEVVAKLVDAVTFIHQAIVEAFDENATSSTMNGKEAYKEPKRLGVAGLALHYANLITQINIIASRPTSLPPNIRDTLYNGLPASVRAILYSRLRALKYQKVMTVPQVKAEMDKTLNWLVPLATDTIKRRAQQGFGFVGEWANTGNELGTKTGGSNNIIRLQTLYHADKRKMDAYIFDMIIWLQRLIWLVRHQEYTPSPPTSKAGSNLHTDGKLETIKMSPEDKNLFEEGNETENVGSRSKKKQDFMMVKKRGL